MAARVGSLFTELTVDASGLVTGLGRAGSRLEGFERDSNTRLGRLDRGFSGTFGRIGNAGAARFASLAKGALLALGPILSVSAALGTAKAALHDFDSIAKSAKASGLSGEIFQEFAYSAELGGVATDQLAKALETFSKNSGLAAEGKGRMVTQLKALNPELLKSILATTDQAARFKLAADAIDQAGTASEKAALSTVLFGDAGTRMVEALKGGSTALNETAKKARELGLVIDNELLSRAETLNDEFATASRVMDLEFKRTMIDLAPVLISTAQLAGAVARGIGDIVDSMKSLEARSTAGLEDRLTFLKKGGLGNGPGNRSEGADNVAAADEIAAIQAVLKQRAIQNLREQLTAPARVTVDGGTVDLDFGSGSRNAAADAAIKHAEAVRKLIADLQFERATIGETALEQDILNTLRNAGVDGASAEGLAIRGLITDLDAQKSAIERNADAIREFEDLSRTALRGFATDLKNGVSFADALGNAVGRLSDRMLDMAIDLGTSALSGFFGNMLKGITGGTGGGFVPGITGPSIRGFSNGGGGIVGNTGNYMPGAPDNTLFVAKAQRGEPFAFGDAAINGLGNPRDRASNWMPGVSTIEVRNKLEIEIKGDDYKVHSQSQKKGSVMNIDQIVLAPVKKAFADGSMDSLFAATYGLKRRPS